MNVAFIVNDVSCLNYLLSNNLDYEGRCINEFYFFSFSHYIKERLGKKVVNCFLLDDMISEKDARDNTHNFLLLANSWFRDENGRDVFEYRGVPVAECCMSDFIGSKITFFHRCFYAIAAAAAKYKINMFYCDKPQNNIFFKCCEILNIKFKLINCAGNLKEEVSIVNEIAQYDLTSIPEQYKSSGFGEYKKKAYNFLKSFAGGIKQDIIISLYFNNLPMINKCGSIKYRKYRLHSVNTLADHYKFLFEDFRIINLKLSAVNLERYFYDDNKINVVINKIKLNFSINGYDCSSVLLEEIVEFIKKTIPQLYFIIDSLIEYFDGVNVRALILPFDCTFIERAMTYLFCREKIKIIKIQHAIYPIEYLNDVYYNISDDVFVFALHNAVFFKNSRVHFLPSPLYDNYVDFKKELKVRNDKKTIIINPFHSVGYMFFLKMYDEERFLIDVMSVLKKYETDLKIIIRMHPGISSNYFKFLLAEKFPDVKFIYSSEKYFQDAIKKADLYISALSTSVFESAAAGVPVLYYNNIKFDFSSPFNLSNTDLPQAVCAGELEAWIDRFFMCNGRVDWFTSKEVIEKYGVYINGNNSSKMWEAIDGIICKNEQKNKKAGV